MSELELKHTVNEVCPRLAENERCFCSLRFSQGKRSMLFHMHIPKHRVSSDMALRIIEDLLAKSAEWSHEFLVTSRLNRRSGAPDKYPSLNYHTSHIISATENFKGVVLRQMISTTDAWAWTDFPLKKIDQMKKVVGLTGGVESEDNLDDLLNSWQPLDEGLPEVDDLQVANKEVFDK